MKVRAKVSFSSTSEGVVHVGDVIEVTDERGAELKDSGLCVGAAASAELVHAVPEAPVKAKR